MPLYEDYKECIKSDVADIKNTGGRRVSRGTAGYFLPRNLLKIPHVDILTLLQQPGLTVTDPTVPKVQQGWVSD